MREPPLLRLHRRGPGGHPGVRPARFASRIAITRATWPIWRRARPDAEAEIDVRGVAADQVFERERRTWRELFSPCGTGSPRLARFRTGPGRACGVGSP